MLLKQVTLQNFRNFEKETFYFNPFLTIVIGENARGKTSLLESIYFLLNGSGFRETKEVELINFKDDKTTASTEGLFTEGDGRIFFKIIIVRKDQLIQKTFLVNKVKKKYTQYLKEQIKAVLFTPQQIEIITGSPHGRRDYFNKLISFYDFEYKKRLDNFDQALRKRNKILEGFKYEAQLEEELSFWNDYLEEQAQYLTQKRNDYTEFLNKHNSIEKKTFSIKYLKNEFTKDRLKKFSELERRIRRTMIGPQKDDFQFFIEEKDVHHFGSRSEQRLTLLWMKINEMQYYETKIGKKPILLFDDVFSELDLKNKALVLTLMRKYQSIVTTTDLEVLELTDIPKSIIKL